VHSTQENILLMALKLTPPIAEEPIGLAGRGM